jgi:hypothetical protein
MRIVPIASCWPYVTAMKVEVAAVRLSRPPLFQGPGDVMQHLGQDVPWSDRTRASLNVEERTRLLRVLDNGADRLALKVSESDVWSRDRKPSDHFQGFFFDSGADHGQIVQFDTTLNEDGTAQWWFGSEDITVADVLAAKEAGLFTGDPSRILVVVDEPPEGVGNVLDFWFEVLRVLPEIQQYAKAAADAVAPWATLAGVIAGANAVVQKVRTRWDTTGGDLKRFEQLFKLPRTTPQAAALLGIDEQQVPALLHFLGLEQTRDAYWRPSNQPERKQLAELAGVADRAAHMSLTVAALRNGLAEVLALPSGDRAKQAEGIFRRHQFESFEQGPDRDPYITRSESGRDDQFDVVKFHSTDSEVERVVLGAIQIESDGRYSIVDPDGRKVVDRHGSEMRFHSLDRAATFIGGGYKAG